MFLLYQTTIDSAVVSLKYYATFETKARTMIHPFDVTILGIIAFAILIFVLAYDEER